MTLFLEYITYTNSFIHSFNFHHSCFYFTKNKQTTAYVLLFSKADSHQLHLHQEQSLYHRSEGDVPIHRYTQQIQHHQFNSATALVCLTSTHNHSKKWSRCKKQIKTIHLNFFSTFHSNIYLEIIFMQRNDGYVFSYNFCCCPCFCSCTPSDC